MQTIQALLGFPNGTPIDAVTARLTKVYKRKDITTTYGPKTIQDGYLEDASGGKIKFKAWSHPDLTPLEGKEFVIHADGKGKGLVVKHETYNGANGQKTDILLEVGKTGAFQVVAVYDAHKAPNGAPAAQVAPTPTPAPQNPVKGQETPNAGQALVGYNGKTVHGATAGAAHNKAVDILIHTGTLNPATLEQDVVSLGAKLVRAAQRLEAGDQGVTAATPKPGAPVVDEESLPF